MLTLDFNMEVNKTPLASQQQVILGNLWDSVRSVAPTAEKKQQKYLKRISDVSKAESTAVIDILRLHGNLNYAAAVAPYGRPFLAPLTQACVGRSIAEKVTITEDIRLCLQIWRSILTVNRGVTFAYLTDALPRSKDDVFVDASSSWGIGGICGSAYFKYSWDELKIIQPDIIARMELLACLVALTCFSNTLSGKIVRIYCDTENAVA